MNFTKPANVLGNLITKNKHFLTFYNFPKAKISQFRKIKVTASNVTF